MRREGCAALSRRAGESLFGTAPENGGAWLAIEYPGPWPSLETFRVLPEVARRVVGRAVEAGIRPQLIRRCGRRSYLPPPHWVFVSSSRNDQPWIEAIQLDNLADLQHLDLSSVAAGSPPGFGVMRNRPLLLICTHGRRDACCAEYGRPAAAAMAARYPDDVWETTHLAGDRFAGNVACLPASIYHGRVMTSSALQVADACMRGEIVLEHYRGRAGLSAPAQAAEQAVRKLTGDRGHYSVSEIRCESLGQGEHDVRVRVRERRFAVQVRESVGEPRRAVCADCPLATPLCYVIEDVHELAVA